MKLNERAKFRRRAGLTQHRLARLSGVKATRISLWECGELELPPREIEKIARAITEELNRVPIVSTATEVAQALTAVTAD